MRGGGSGECGQSKDFGAQSGWCCVTELEKRSPGKRYGVDVMSQARGRVEDQGVPIEVRKAAERLRARLVADLTSPSQVPLSDLDIIFGYIKRRLDL
jgi:hypothetical protein